MLLKQKKRLLYLLSVTFGLVLTVFAISKDNEVKQELTSGFNIPVANADTPPPVGDGDTASDWGTGDTGDTGGGGDTNPYSRTSDSDGDDGDDSSRSR